MKLVIEPISAEAFAPYGTVVAAPAQIGRTAFPDALLSKRPNAHATLSASRIMPCRSSAASGGCVSMRHQPISRP